MRQIKVILAILVLALLGIQNCFGSCYTLPGPDSNEVRLFAQDVCGSVSNNPPNPTIFTLDSPKTITKIGTYHWNSGQGTPAPGTIGLQDQNGKTYGPWQASGAPGMGGVPNANWIATLKTRLDLPAGTYKVIDSDPSTWAYNSESGDCGVVSVIGLGGDSTVASKAPCAGEGATDLSIASPTDQYRAGPSLTPGSYKIWYGKRTGTDIGQPDNWNTKPVELLDGKFYVFDVSTGGFGEANPQMFNPMLSNPTPGESVVWYKASTQYAYVVCFDGPLNVDNTKVAQAPCGEGATDLSPASPTDQYRAGPILTPGSYKIWYGKRTGTQIGQPDNWNTKPVELLDGKFYVFDVSTGGFGEANPQMINPMLSNPTQGESAVWYKASTQYAYVVCFDGPLNPSKRAPQPTGNTAGGSITI